MGAALTLAECSLFGDPSARAKEVKGGHNDLTVLASPNKVCLSLATAHIVLFLERLGQVASGLEGGIRSGSR